MITIKVDEQGKLYWVKDWPEPASIDKGEFQAIEIADSSLIAAEHSIVTYIPGIYTIEADGRFEVRTPNWIHPEEQLAYWITDKHEENGEDKKD